MVENKGDEEKKKENIVLNPLEILMLLGFMVVFLSATILLPLYLGEVKNQKKEDKFESVYSSTVKDILDKSLNDYEELQGHLWTPILDGIKNNSVDEDEVNRQLISYVSGLHQIEDDLLGINRGDFPNSLNEKMYCIANGITNATENMASLAIQLNKLNYGTEQSEEEMKLIVHGETKAEEEFSKAKSCKVDVEYQLFTKRT